MTVLYSNPCYNEVCYEGTVLYSQSLTHKAQPIIYSRRQFQILLLFSKITEKICYFMRIVCWQMILKKYHTLFFSKIGKDVNKFVICCSCDWRFKG